MVRRRDPKVARQGFVPADEATVQEHLPYPIVYYPPQSGFFFAFAADESSPAVLCACSRPAVDNAIQLGLQAAERAQSPPASVHLARSVLWPRVIVDQAGVDVQDPLSTIQFEKGLCHRCNLAAPTLRYCHETEGGRFIQYYGWYVGQAYYRYGICPDPLDYLPDVCPEELRWYVQAIAAAVVSDAQRGTASPDEALYRQIRQRDATRAYRRASRLLDKQIENVVREEFGFKKVGEGWVSETLLYQLVGRVFADQTVLRRHRPDWLGGLELDIYLPDLKLAFEYQGQQHFHPIKLWGGKEALEAMQCRDARKAEICAERGVTLIAIDYTEPLVEPYIRDVLGMTVTGRDRSGE